MIWGQHYLLAGLGILLWGLGASLGFPVGLSAAGDDPRGAAVRVGAVATIGYIALTCGSPACFNCSAHWRYCCWFDIGCCPACGDER
ncbi:hypothetical protein ACXHJ2_20105 [Paenibacillus sp. ALE3]|uniref:hypothetical protein n=1 Tax=unclassified Paenibacillus TaxID=185978 RepID=UPI00406C5ABD